MANRIVDRTGRDVARYLLILCAVIRSPLRYAILKLSQFGLLRNDAT